MLNPFTSRVPSRLPPGPTTPMLWQTFLAVAKPHEYIRSLQAEFGDVISFRSLAGRGVAVCASRPCTRRWVASCGSGSRRSRAERRSRSRT